MVDQLPGWTDGQAKARILEFVRSVTEPGDGFVPPSHGVAAFDNIPPQRVIGSGASMQNGLNVVFDL